jgi:hypothetical protein
MRQNLNRYLHATLTLVTTGEEDDEKTEEKHVSKIEMR